MSNHRDQRKGEKHRVLPCNLFAGREPILVLLFGITLTLVLLVTTYFLFIAIGLEEQMNWVVGFGVFCLLMWMKIAHDFKKSK
ncbi:hypothetical protein AYO08_21830 [Pseudomonas putida]|uniref:hypothetical protein n=1 Tax=Pseudomonas putida TaxID=303 RepID=UPI0007DC0B37|nr:hypothetical protein [Pseudomonas putida]OAS27565.1 hypothetical protein AYO08_21830 [Pseudomonas putida]QNV69367.1 hypothetical protein F7661_28005 [Pseudomonas sp. CFA]